MKSAPVMVVGGSGFLGAHVCRLLIDKGHRVISYDIKPPPAGIGAVHFIEGDILDGEDLATSVEESGAAGMIDVVGGTGDEAAARTDPKPAIKINVKGTLDVLESAKKNRLKRVVYVGTGGVYGKRNDTRPIAEDEPISWRGTIYHPSHYMGEILVGMYQEIYGLDAVILRPLSMYGPAIGTYRPREWPGFGKFYDGWILRAMNGEEVEVKGADTLSDLTHVQDVAAAVCLAYQAGNLQHRLFNVSSGVLVSHREIAETIERYLPKARFTYLPGTQENPLRPNRGPLDISRARKELGFKPRYDLAAGMKEYIEWVSENVSGVIKLK
jgi:nucleoside-diphosphate-sugar epimerase